MDNSRRSFLLGAALSVSMLLAACSTPAIDSGHHYTENVSSILISQDKQKLVFIGKPYHYIFDAPAGVVSTLEHPFHSKVVGDLADFHVNNHDVVTGLYSLRIEGELGEQDKLDATAAGYQPDANGQLTLAGKLSGIRYEEDTSILGNIRAYRNRQDHPEQKPGAPEALNKTYSINVKYDPAGGEKVADKLISPVVVSNDGLYLLFNLYLVPVVIPLAIMNVSSDCFPYCMTSSKPK